MKKKHKLIVITPSGKKYEIGFLSQSRNGYVLGYPRVEGVDTSHLTILSREGKLSSHITPQEGGKKRQFFPELNLEEFGKGLENRLDPNLIRALSEEEMSQKVVYITQKFWDWIKSIVDILHEKRTSPKEVVHVFNLKRLSEKAPELIQDIKDSPQSFIGLCKAEEILNDGSKKYGFTDSQLVIIPFESELYVLNLSLISNFRPKISKEDLSDPLSEIYQSLGIPQYMKEIQKKEIIEKLLAKSSEEG